MQLVESMVWKGKRFRAVFNRMHRRPPSETFHEFLLNVVKWSFGERWWRQQIGMRPEARHVVVQWSFDWADLAGAGVSGKDCALDTGVHESPATGTVWALLQLGYDLFCLQAKNKLPEFLVDRLRNHREFQSARYEIAVAAVMTRSGFEIDYLDNKGIAEKHCEFLAAHRSSGVRMGVEAKSRRRDGVLHEKGEFQAAEDPRGLARLLRRAADQGPEGLPLLVFLDVNLPPEPGVPHGEKPWVRDVMGMLDRIGHNSAERPDRFAAVFVTSFSPHFGWDCGKASHGESGMILPRFAAIAAPAELLAVINETLSKYERIPDEI